LSLASKPAPPFAFGFFENPGVASNLFALITAPCAAGLGARAFQSGRDFSAWVGLVPKQNSSGGKDKLGNISKRRDRYLRSLFTAGALAVIRYAKTFGTKAQGQDQTGDGCRPAELFNS
jgi:transposase